MTVELGCRYCGSPVDESRAPGPICGCDGEMANLLGRDLGICREALQKIRDIIDLCADMYTANCALEIATDALKRTADSE